MFHANERVGRTSGCLPPSKIPLLAAAPAAAKPDTPSATSASTRLTPARIAGEKPSHSNWISSVTCSRWDVGGVLGRCCPEATALGLLYVGMC